MSLPGAATRDYSRGDFNRFFWGKYAELTLAALDPRKQRPNYKDGAVIESIAAGYRNLPPAPPTPAVPRQIFMLWQQGWASAPPIVRLCAESWRRQNPSWELHLLDERTLPEFAPSWSDFRRPERGRESQSNIARLALLKAYGGVWADATTFCTQPLDRWLPAAELFIFSRPRPYRYLDIWFIAAAKQSPAIAAWHEMVRQYWTHFTKGHHYYWMEYLFEYLCATNPVAKRAWEAMPKYSALGPLAVQGDPFDRAAPKATFELIEQNIVPINKMSHKWPYDGPLEGTPVGMLTGLKRLREPA